MTKAERKRKEALDQLLNPRLHGKNIIEHMRLQADLEEARRKYFYRQSKLWRAIQEYIGRSKVGECALINKKGPIVMHSATGYAVNLKDAYVCPPDYSIQPPKEAANFCLVIDITYIHEDREHCDKEWLYVPCELEVNYTEKAFKQWIGGLTRKQKAEQAKKNVEKLKVLVKKYPKEAAQLVGSQV